MTGTRRRPRIRDFSFVNRGASLAALTSTHFVPENASKTDDRTQKYACEETIARRARAWADSIRGNVLLGFTVGSRLSNDPRRSLQSVLAAGLDSAHVRVHVGSVSLGNFTSC